MHYDAIVIGGSQSGLAAGYYLCCMWPRNAGPSRSVIGVSLLSAGAIAPLRSASNWRRLLT
jgi:hypothetical protein